MLKPERGVMLARRKAEPVTCREEGIVRLNEGTAARGTFFWAFARYRTYSATVQTVTDCIIVRFCRSASERVFDCAAEALTCSCGSLVIGV